MNELTILMVSSWAMVSFSSAMELNLQEAILEIRKAPDWSSLTHENLLVSGPKIMASLEKYGGLAPEDARRLVTSLTASGDEFDLNVGSKIYVFNRIYCDVPESAVQKTWESFGSWVGVPYKDGFVNSLYPLALSKDGKLELRYSFGGYAGGPYRGVEEFDFLFKRFGKRKPHK